MKFLYLLYSLVLIGTFCAVAVATYSIAAAAVSQPNLLGIRGMKRVRALEHNTSFASLEPAVRWLGTQMRRVLSDGALSSIEQQLVLGGDFLGLLGEEFVALCILSAVGGGVPGVVYALFVDGNVAGFAVGGVLVGGLLPLTRLKSAQQLRRQQAIRALPPVTDLLVLCLSAGLDLPGALRHVVSQCSNPERPLIEELGFVLQELTVGKTRKVALTQLGERLPFEPVRELVGAIIQAEEHGNPLARVLQIHAEVSRQQRTVRAEEAASRAGVKMMIPMVMIFAAILVVIIGPMALSVKDKF